MTAARGRSAAGEDTRQRILDAALATLTAEGIAGTSARAIATRGGFNQSLIFYHFGSVADLLVAATRMLSEARLSRYRDRVAEVRTLSELAAVAAELHEQDIRDGQVTVLAQMLAGASSFPDIAGDLMAVFQPWIDLVDTVVQRLLPDSPLTALIRTDDVAYTVAALFVGLELLTSLDGDRDREQRLFAMFEAAAALGEGMLHLASQEPQDE